ncbi:MAG: hypothetical protein K2R98_34160 [Gemmataceae bacterium]|nr:hypothetical protein [Gemmataceae bacterium]
MMRSLLALLVGVAVITAPLVGADAPKADPDKKTPVEIKNEAALREMLIAQKYREFELALVRLAQRLEKSTKAEDKEKAKFLKEALETAGKGGITTRFERLISILKESKANNLSEIKEAIDLGERLAQDMRDMLKLIMQDGQIKANHDLQIRLAELIKMLEALIRNQKLVRVHTEKDSMPKNELVKGQDKVTDNTEKFAKDMEDKSQPGADRIPGKELVRAATVDQRMATTHINANSKDNASGSQSQAIDKLVKVRDALDKLLKQLREEEMKQILQSLQARCELMLQMQIEVKDGTVILEKTIKANEEGKAKPEDHRKSLALATREGSIIGEADRAIQMIKEEGSAVAFLEVFQQVRQDMAIVELRLGKTDAGQLTQTIEQDIIDTLKEMIEVLKKAQNPPGGGTNPKPPDPADAGKLLSPLAELIMIRSMQAKINTRTETVSKRFEGEEPDSPDLRKDLRDLSDRQLRIQRVTRDIFTEKNK